MTMLRINQETGSMDSIYEYADEISDRRLEADREAMRSLCVLSREQIDTIGASAIRTIYELTEEQASGWSACMNRKTRKRITGM